MSSDDSEQWPIRIEEAARRFGCGLRRLKTIAKQNGIGKKAGRTVLLDEAAFRELYRVLPDNGSRSGAVPRPSIASGPLDAKVTKRLRARTAQKHPGRRGKRDYLKDHTSPSVVPFSPEKKP